jgi:hypothetical protein
MPLAPTTEPLTTVPATVVVTAAAQTPEETSVVTITTSKAKPKVKVTTMKTEVPVTEAPIGIQTALIALGLSGFVISKR